LPAIVKGWFDRVCAYGVAYADGKRFDQGFFVGRRAVLGVVTGGTPERFSAGGSYGPMPEVLYPLRRCILEYLGLEVMEPFVAYAAPRVDAATRAEYLRGFEACLLATAGDPDWQARLSAVAGTTAHNRVIPEGRPGPRSGRDRSGRAELRTAAACLGAADRDQWRPSGLISQSSR
jgi:NAD(P)H dehydrogenase (quinone)